MQLTTLPMLAVSFILITHATAAALPNSTTNSTALIAAPTPSPLFILETQAPRGRNTAKCVGKSDSEYTLEFRIQTSGPAYATDAGKGLLDNLRGQCGVITNWGFDYSKDRKTGLATFLTSNVIRGHCVEDAVWLSTLPTGAVKGLQCTWTEFGP